MSTESSLRAAVVQALADAPHVSEDEISAQVVDDDVTLHGTVGSLLARDEAGAAVHNVPGVRHVDNELRVRILGYDRHNDADIQATILDALFADPELHAASLDAEFKDGTVTLRGDVETTEMRGRAERIAREVPGVHTVRNELKAYL
jgi:hyperosmotically inducible periplasmic protein